MDGVTEQRWNTSTYRSPRRDTFVRDAGVNCLANSNAAATIVVCVKLITR